MHNNDQINGFKDLDDDPLYRGCYGASIAVLKNVIPFISSDDDDIGDQLGRSVKAVPRLLATALHANMPDDRKKRSMNEASLNCREAAVMLSFCRDLHGRFINASLCSELIDTYRRVANELEKMSLPPPAAEEGE